MKINKIILLAIFILTFMPLASNPFYSTNNDNKGKETIEKCDVVPITVVGQGSELNIKAQRDLREKIAYNLNSLKTASGVNKTKIIFLLFVLSLIYGLIHAIGPGHRKMIVFSIYLTRKAPWYEPMVTGGVLAFLHGGCSVLLILIYKGITSLSIGIKTNIASIYLEGFSYLVIILIALYLLIKETIEHVKCRKKELQVKDSSKIKLIPFLVSGIYPCPGALLILIFTFTLDLLSYGILCVIAMSIGMGIVIIVIAYFARLGRTKILEVASKNKVKINNITYAIEMISYAFMLFFSIYISGPFIKSIL